jgi:hypothetical protein
MIIKGLTASNPNISPLTMIGKTAITTEGKINVFADNLGYIFTINPDASHSFTVSIEQV